MSEKMILPTDAMMAAGHESAEIMQRAGRSLGSQCRWAIYAALNHPDAAGLLAAEWKANAEAAAERAERAEDLLADSVHVDEAARRIEAAREQGWDDAANWVKQREAWTDEELRAANPHRPVQELPTEPGTVIVPAEGREFIEASALHVTGAQYCREAVYEDPYYYGVWWRDGKAVHNGWRAENITPGTWKVDNR